MEHLVILRSYGDILNLKNYNCQEIGLGKSLLKKGLKVTILMAGDENVESQINTEYGSLTISFIKISWKLHARYCWFQGLEKRLDKLDPTLLQVHDMDLLMTWRAVRWAKKRNIPCFLIQGPYDKWRKPILRQLNEIYNRTFGCYILNNVKKIGVKTILADYYLNGYVKCKTKLTPVGLDTSVFTESVIKDWKKELGLTGKKILLYVGSIQARRNPYFLLELLGSLPDSYVLIMVGKGNLLNDIKCKISSSNLCDRCFILERLSQKELPSLYMASDCFLLPSDYEIFGMVLMESMFFGLPVITTKTTGSDFIVEDKKSGFIIPELNVEKWAQCIHNLCYNQDLHNSISQNSQKRIQKMFLWDSISANFFSLYFDKEQ